MILEEFDPDRSAVVNPYRNNRQPGDFPGVAVSCFTGSMFRHMLSHASGNTDSLELQTGAGIRPIAYSPGMGRPIYKVTRNDTDIALFMMPVGAPAAAAALEDVYAMGAERIIVFGTCGVLDRSIADGSVIIPVSAIRDEGTSYHYAPPSDEIDVNKLHKAEFEELLDARGIRHIRGKVWTTDAVYRETRTKITRRRKQGCICVDMECSALAAVSQFRGKELFQFFYAADNLDADEWEARSLGAGRRAKSKISLSETALDFATKLSKL